MSTVAYVCQGVRTPIGRYGGALSGVRPDDLAAHVIRTLKDSLPSADWERLDEVLLGCANQAGEDNRNVARMALLLAGVPKAVPGVTVNRLCASGLEAVAAAARGISTGDLQVAIAGGVESMSRAPFVMPKSATPFSRNAEIYDSTIGWRFVNPAMQTLYGAIPLGETAENVAGQYQVSRRAQDEFALRSQQRAQAARVSGIFTQEIAAVDAGKRAVAEDEHPRPETTLEGLAALAPAFRKDGTVTAGNSSGVNDGACAMLLASEQGAQQFGLTPLARVVGSAAAGVDPGLMGVGPIPAMQKLLDRTKLTIHQMDVIELNEAFAAQALACLRAFGLPDDAAQVNANGGAIALGHPLGMSGARLVLTAARQLQRVNGRYALVAMCVGVGQGMALLLERV